MAIFLLATTFTQAQITNNLELPTSINEDGSAPDVSAILDVQSTAKGVLVPRMTEAQRTAIATPANGLLVFDTDFGSFFFYNGSEWASLSYPHALADRDMDTRIQVEEGPDDDIIRMDVKGSERIVVRNNIPDSRTILEFHNNGDNVLIGRSAGDSLTTGDNNAIIGHQAGRLNEIGNGNVFMGTRAGEKHKSPFSNTFIGYQTGMNAFGGGDNTFIGSHTGMRTTTGGENTFLGAFTGLENTTGGFNTFLGRFAGKDNTTGGGNTYVGWFAGGLDSLGSGNVFLGSEAGFNEQGSNRLYIENSPTDSTGALIYGEFDNDFVRINGKLIATQGLNDGDMDTKIQVEESADEDIIRMDLGGDEVLFLKKNNAIGDHLMIDLPNNDENTFLGHNAGRDMTTGSINTFIGNGSGENLETGINNSFLGAFSGLNIVNGGENVFFGSNAGKNHQSGDSNVYIGSEAGANNLNGSANVFLGRSAGFNETGSNKLYIDNSSTADPLLYGEFSNDFVRVNGRLEATLGFVDADNDTKIQVEESADEDIIRFDLAGSERWQMTNGQLVPVNSGGSVLIGSGAGAADDYVTRRNIAIGELAMSSNTKHYNVVMGFHALRNNVNGNSNTAIGYEALQQNLGTGNVALGASAGLTFTGSNQLFIENSASVNPLIWGDFSSDIVRVNGRLEATQGFADADNDTKIQVEESADEDIIRFDLAGTEFARMEGNIFHIGGSNLLVGQNAGLVNAGNRNTFLGFEAGRNNTGSQSTFVGYKAGLAATGEGANTFMGRSAGELNTGGGNTFIGFFTGQKNEGFSNVFLGESAGQEHTTGNTNVFIGKHSGRNNLTGSGNVFLGFGSGENETGSNLLYIDNTNTSTPLIWGDFNSNLVQVNGDLGIGITPTQLLHLNGGAFCDGTTWTNASDRRLKKDIAPIGYGLGEIMALRPVNYEMKSNGKQQIGFIAQEVRDILPELVSGTEGDVEKGETLGMSYGNLTAVLVKGMQEQQAIIQKQQADIENLQAQLTEMDQLKAESTDLKQRMAKLEAALLGNPKKNVGED